MEILRKELNNKEYWEQTYDRMVSKQGFSKEDKDKLWVVKEISRTDIIEELLSGSYEWSTPKKVAIAKAESKKKRIVYIYNTKDRYVLGVLYRAVSARFRDLVSDSCFSYKTGTSTSHAIQYIKNNRNETYKYGVKIDIHAYFNSVSKERLTEIINELFSGGMKKTLEKLLLTDKVMYKGNEIEEYKSLIPGCAFGSFLANYCLRECDEYFDNEKAIYARYSDDIIILSDSKEKLNNYLDKVMEYLNKYGLTMNPDKYTWFEPGDSLQYLGLKLDDNGKIDISDHSKQKIKKQIHRWCRKGRMEIERDYKPFEVVAKRIIRKLNNKNFKCYIRNDGSFGWAIYSYPRITTIETLIEIDRYTRDTLRAMKTGKHNKANVKAISDEEFKQLGWVSLVDMYLLYKEDFDYYCEIVELL